MAQVWENVSLFVILGHAKSTAHSLFVILGHAKSTAHSLFVIWATLKALHTVCLWFTKYWSMWADTHTAKWERDGLAYWHTFPPIPSLVANCICFSRTIICTINSLIELITGNHRSHYKDWTNVILHSGRCCTLKM